LRTPATVALFVPNGTAALPRMRVWPVCKLINARARAQMVVLA
jgi:hypothetical protein